MVHSARKQVFFKCLIGLFTRNEISDLFSRFYGYTVSNQGVAEKHGSDYKADYFTDRICDHAVQFIRDSAGGSSPFFMYVATPAPHRPATPAPQYEHSFDGKQAPRTPSYNDSGQDKHWLISQG